MNFSWFCPKEGHYNCYSIPMAWMPSAWMISSNKCHDICIKCQDVMCINAHDNDASEDIQFSDLMTDLNKKGSIHVDSKWVAIRIFRTNDKSSDKRKVSPIFLEMQPFTFWWCTYTHRVGEEEYQVLTVVFHDSTLQALKYHFPFLFLSYRECRWKHSNTCHPQIQKQKSCMSPKTHWAEFCDRKLWQQIHTRSSNLEGNKIEWRQG